jgi:type IV pilus assembly protein PilV
MSISGKKGFTLTEVLISLIILSVGILAITTVHITSMKSGYFSNNMTQATVLAQDKLEYLKNLSYNDSDLSSGQHNEGVLPDTIFSRQYTVVEDVGNSLKTISVIIEWADQGNHSISLSTIRAK